MTAGRAIGDDGPTMMKIVRVTTAVCAVIAIPLAASADKFFAAPTGWNHVVVSAAGTPRSQDVWKSSDSPNADVLQLMVDATAKYDDVLASVRANAASGAMLLTIDRDLTCDGKKAHTFELEFGQGKKILVNQTVVADGEGTTRITYTRQDGQPFSNDVKAAIAEYCGST
jgi:hypothetical protein